MAWEDHRIDYVRGVQIDDAVALASAGYDRKSAPSADEINYYALMAGELFFGYFIDNVLVAFVNGIRVAGNDLNINNSIHIPGGDAVLIKAICTDRNFRRLGIATSLLGAFLEQSFSEGMQKVARVLVHSPSKYIPLFTRAGFSFRYQAWYKQGRMPYYELECYHLPERKPVLRRGKTVRRRKAKQ